MKTAAFIVAVAAGSALAQSVSFNGMSDAQLKDYDNKTWGIMQQKPMLSDDANKAEYAGLQTRMAALDKALEKAGDDKIFYKPWCESTMQKLFETIQVPLVKNKQRVNNPSDAPAAGVSSKGTDFNALSIKALDSLSIILDRIDKNSRWKVMELVDYAMVMQMSQRYAKWDMIVTRLNAWQHSKTLAEFDNAFGRFMRPLASHPESMAEGTRWLRGTGMDKFANSDCKKEAFFDRDLRTIDNYLAVLRDTEVQAYKNALNEFTVKWNAALDAIDGDAEYFKAHGMNLLPPDRAKIDSLLDSLSYLMLHAKEYIGVAKELILKVDTSDVGSEIYKLRNCLIGPNRAFYCAGSVQGNGCPGYSRRVRVALEDCKNEYMKNYRRIKGSDATWH